MKNSLPIETLLLALIIACLTGCIAYFAANGHLPPPFFWAPNDDLMDWYNTSAWANYRGMYDVWYSVYPPISFVFSRLVSIHRCYTGFDPFYSRDCDWLGRDALLFLYALSAILVLMAYRRRGKTTALVRTAALMLGFPMLYAVDRGNLVVACFPCFVLSFGGLLHSQRAKWLALAMAINFKPYLVATLLPQLARRRWRWLQGAVVCVLAVYLITFFLNGSGTPLQIVRNQVIWILKAGRGYSEAAWGSTSVASTISFLRHATTVRQIYTAQSIDLAIMILTALRTVGQMAAAAVLVAAALKRIRAPAYRLTAIAVSLAMTTIDVGVYATPLLLFLVFLERWRGAALITALIAAYVISIPADVSFQDLGHAVEYSYLGGRLVDEQFGLTVGEFARPSLLVLLQCCLAAATFLESISSQSKFVSQTGAEQAHAVVG